MYQIITNQYLVVTIYSTSLKEAITEAHDAGLVLISIMELKHNG